MSAKVIKAKLDDVECTGPMNGNVLVSGQLILDTSKIKDIIPCVPSKIGGGFKVGGSAETNVKGGAEAETSLKDKLLHSGVKVLLGAKGKVSLLGGGFALYNEKVVAADGAVHGSAVVLGKTALVGNLGVKNVRRVVDGSNWMSAASDYCLGANVSVATAEDAVAYVDAYGRVGTTKSSEYGGGFALYNEKVVAADGAVHGSAVMLGKTALVGNLGVKNGRRVVDGSNWMSAASDYCLGANVSVATAEDAVAYVDAYGRVGTTKSSECSGQ